MKLQVCAVYDAAVAAYIPPQFYRSQGEAMRAFIQACQEEKHQFRVHAKDYTLFFLAEFDDTSGGILMQAAPLHLISALQALDMPSR